MVSRNSASGKIIPKGASVAIYLYAMGHNPKTFEDPMVFNPDRFLPENREYKNPYEFIPFCAGQRNCIGTSLEHQLFCIHSILRNSY